MENTSVNLRKDGRKEENTVQCAIETLESKEGILVSKSCRRKLEPRKSLILNIRRSRVNSSCRELFLQNINGSRNSIPKHITTFDEKYVIRCLESIRNCAFRAAAWNFTSKLDILPVDVGNLAEIDNRSSNIMASLAEIDNRSSNITDQWPICTVSGSQSMINILNSPLLQQFGSLDCNDKFGRTDLNDVSEPFYSHFTEPSSILSRKQQKDVKVLDPTYISVPVYKRDSSISSTSSSCSDRSSSSAYGTSFQGMLQCTWKDGLPNHVFTVDDKREVYVANLSKVESLDDKDLDYVYTFYSRRNGKKECDIHELEIETVAKMQVSTSITFSSNNAEVKETRFILSVCHDNHTEETQTLNYGLRKNKTLTRKVVDVFRSSHSYKQRSWGSSAISEDLHNKCAPNLELAAIIVKDISKNRNEAETGGWGLKFLKRPHGNNVSVQALNKPSEFSRNTRECSTSMVDILIPAGFHGGPSTRVSGPSSLIERWISGGRCNCGGWDIGCPLTILNTRSSDTGYSSRVDNSGECKSVDFFMQGSKQNLPIMKMVNIDEDLYYIHFQSTLSTLQCFAIAAAIIHSRSRVLRPQVCRS